MEKKSRGYDMPIDGVADHYLTIKELVESYRSFALVGDYENAMDCILRAVESGNVPAKVECARFLINTPQLRMKQNERYKLAEKYLLDVENLLDLPASAESKIAMQLAGIYEHDRPIAYLACLLKAKRLGMAISDKDIEGCRRRLIRLDVNTLGDEPNDAYRLGVELYRAGGTFGLAELFLREASSANNQELAGRACLYLADLYSENSNSFPNHRLEAIRHYRLAKEKGFPDLLTRDHDKQATSREKTRTHSLARSDS